MTGESLLPPERAVGTVRLARDFVLAAEQFLKRTDPNPSVVPYFLIGHALELSFKAALVVHGTSDDELKDHGHDLDALVAAAAQVLPARLVSEEVRAALALVSRAYRAKAFEYVMPGVARLPEETEMAAVSREFVDRVNRWVDDRVRDSVKSRGTA